jgi:hypothetical protein
MPRPRRDVPRKAGVGGRGNVIVGGLYCWIDLGWMEEGEGGWMVIQQVMLCRKVGVRYFYAYVLLSSYGFGLWGLEYEQIETEVTVVRTF